MGRRVVVIGSKGQLGTELLSEFAQRGWDVTPFDRQALDITSRTAVEAAISNLEPEVVVNAAAYNQVDVAETEPQAAFLTNGLGVANLALACRQSDARLVHFSTDYVFDGEAGRPYTEADATHPLGAYAVSKLAGELYAAAYLDSPLIIRTSGVFGPAGLRNGRGNFVELMLRLAGTGQPIRVVEDFVASPTYAPALASRTVDLVESQHTGVFHIGGGQPISWFDYARQIFQRAGLQPELRATNAREYRTAARRPRFSALANTRLDALGKQMPPLAEAINSYFMRRADLLAGGK